MDKNKVIESASKLIAKGQLEKAVKEYQRVLEFDPDDVRVLQKLAELYQKMKRPAEAADCFEKVARTYATQGFYLKAVALYKQVLKVVERIEVNVRLAAQYLQSHSRQDDYLRVVERISHLDPSDAALAKELANNYLAKGDSKRALAKLQVCFKVNPRDLDTLQMLARAFQDLGQVSKTVSVLKELARVHSDAGRGDEAQKVYQKAAELAPDDLEVKSALVRPAPVEPPPVAPPPVPVPTPAPPRVAPPPPAAGPIQTPVPVRPVQAAPPGHIGQR